MELSAIKGIGPTRLESLRAVGVCSLRDLLYFLPQRYEDRTHPIPCADANGGEVLVMGVVQDAPKLSRFNGLTRVTAYLWDDSGKLPLVWYNQPWMMQNLPVGQTIMLFGRMGQSRGKPVLQNAQRVTEPCILPVYRAVKGIPAKSFREMMQQALEQVDDCCPETLPNDLRIRHQLCELNFAIRQAHFPLNVENLRLARRRLAFEQMLMYQAALGLLRGHKEDGTALPVPPDAPDKFWQTLPFPPTGAQKRVLEEIAADLRCDRAMSRLVQGDVGSGKTLVAAACIWFAHENDCQSAFMAPTEILTEQHEHTLRTLLEPFGIRVGRLTGAMTARQKREVKEALAGGLLDVVVGTHALISDSVTFFRLGLVITDEQHRFGVEQRAALVRKGEQPHTLVMSATPIPRTLALLVYGDLDVSIIDELPPGRQPVQTVCVDERYRARLNAFIDKLIGEGRQVFVVCPKVEETDDVPSDLKSAEEHAQVLQRTFPQHRVACIHGRMKAKDKDACMAAFAAGETDILVSTTVIEVGVDVPNAALMIIENAERFGLSQLHQLRGRIGRGPFQSYCVLVSDAHTDEARARLKVLCDTADGFQIAEADLRQRGPGDFFGNRQHGLPALHIADLGTNMTAVNDARDAARTVLAADPTLSAPEHAALRAQCARLFAANDGHFN